MAYFAPYIDKTGFHMPTYIDIRDKLIEDAKSIFGQDIYLGEDSQDYQWISTVSEKIYDAFQIAQSVYNNRGPNVAIGSGLDSIVKVNGIKRKSATYSKCMVTISGMGNTEIKNGVVTDKGNIKWNLPSIVSIPESGHIDVMAVCDIPGPIVANPGDITGIYNPTFGWNGVYNKDNGELGSYIEDDSKLRKRQSQSTAQPSQTVLTGIEGSIAQLTGVTRYRVYENDTNITDSNGLPPHSITCVVEGGNEQDIAKVLYIRKTPGGYTNGDVEVTLKDSEGNIFYNALNETEKRRFYRPSYMDIDVTITLKALKGYTNQNTKNIKSTLQSYLNSLQIGVDLSTSSIWGAALSTMPDLRNPAFSIISVTVGKHAQTQTTSDIRIAFNEVVRGNINNITVNIT